MQPRIYTYKITFEEVPYWYWGVHKEKKFREFYLGSPVTHKWVWDFYTPKVQILEFFPNTEEGWKEANLVEDRLILPDLNNPLCLNEFVNGCGLSLKLRAENGKKTMEKNLEKNPNHQSEVGKLGGKRSTELGYLDKFRTPEAQRERGIKGGQKTARLGYLDKYRTSEHQSRIARLQWVDPDHPELGSHGAGTLASMQKRRGYPHGKENRVRIE